MTTGYELSKTQVYAGLMDALDLRAGESLHDAAARVVSTVSHRTQTRLAAHAVLDTSRQADDLPGLRRALRFARITGGTR